jgi:hypothetical protein
MRKALPTERERLAIALGLYRMRESLPGPIWINEVTLTIVLDTGSLAEPLRRLVSWPQAKRIVDGEDWRQVLGQIEKKESRWH